MFQNLSHSQRGILYALLGYTSFAFADTNAKWLTDTFSLFQIMSFQSMVSIVILIALSSKIGGWSGWNDKKEFYIHLLRGFLNFFISILVIFSFTQLSLAEVYAMIFAKPFLVVPMAMFIYGETVTKKRWTIIGMGFIGVLLILQPGLNMNPALLLPLLAAALVAILFLSSRSIKVASPFILTLYPMAITLILSLPFTIAYFIMPSAAQMLHFALGGLLVTSGMMFLSMAFQEIDASKVTPFLYTEMIWGLFFGYILFGDIPNIWMIFGSAIIIGSGIYLVMSERKTSSRQA